MPNVPDPTAFAEQWWNWWRACNPSWRVTGNSNTLLRECNGTLDGATATGVNGLLSVLATLWWWRAKTPDSNTAINDWDDAMDDVLWVLEHTSLDDGANSGEEPSPKR